MIEKRKEQEQSAKRASDSSVRIAGEGDAASVRSAGSAVERLSDTMSFKTAAGSALSRKEKRQQREQLCRAKKGSDRVFLTGTSHSWRQQSAAMLGISPRALMHLSEEEINRLRYLLVTQSVDVISGGLVCRTKLMGSVEMIPEVREGVAGTVLRVTVATQAEVFLPTRDPKELEERKAAIAGELIDKAVSAVANVGKNDSAEQRMLRSMLKGELQMVNLNKAPGVKDACGIHRKRKR
jgi:hypothetical protein